MSQRHTSRVNYARLSGRVAHIGGFGGSGKGELRQLNLTSTTPSIALMLPAISGVRR